MYFLLWNFVSEPPCSEFSLKIRFIQIIQRQSLLLQIILIKNIEKKYKIFYRDSVVDHFLDVETKDPVLRPGKVEILFSLSTWICTFYIFLIFLFSTFYYYVFQITSEWGQWSLYLLKCIIIFLDIISSNHSCCYE